MGKESLTARLLRLWKMTNLCLGESDEKKTSTVKMNGEHIPIIPTEPNEHITFTVGESGKELELTGNREGLLLLAKAAPGMAETLR